MDKQTFTRILCLTYRINFVLISKEKFYLNLKEKKIILISKETFYHEKIIFYGHTKTELYKNEKNFFCFLD